MKDHRSSNVVESPGAAHLFAASRAHRVAKVITSVRWCKNDVRSVEAMCRLSTVGLAMGTFRIWCQGEGLTAGVALQFARVLRAFSWASLAGCEFTECLDADYRTVRSMLARGGLSHLLADQTTSLTLERLCKEQRYVLNAHIIDDVLSICRQQEEGGLKPQDHSSSVENRPQKI